MAITVRKIVSQFLRWCEDSRAKRTHDAYKHHLGKLVSMIPNKLAARLRPVDLTRWAKTWHEFQAAKRCFAWAATEAGLLRASPFAKVKLPPMGFRTRTMTPQEIARFLRGLRPSPRLFFLALRETMARPQEIRSVRWCDLRSEQPGEPIEQALPAGRALLVLHEYKSRKQRRESDKPRVLLVSPRLGRAILRLRDSRKSETAPIFANSNGKPWSRNAVRCVVRRLRRRLRITADAQGENVVAYTFRHSMATIAAASGVLDRTLADLLGHSETRTTAKYQHLCVGHLRNAFARIEELRRAKRNPAKRRKSAKA